MRAFWSAVLLLALAGQGLTQDEPASEPGGDKPGAEGKEAPEPPKEAPAWKLPEREAKRLEALLKDYLRPRRLEDRKNSLEKLQKFNAKDVGGHSVLEDVSAIVSMANRQRTFDPKVGKKGKVDLAEVTPAVHGFPGGIGTVKYHLYLPKNYTEKQLWPLIFCLPDNKKWPDGKKYLEEAWVKRSPKVADEFVVVVPVPQSKGEDWMEERSHARAMISLRHASGTFDAAKKSGGPAVDMLRMFIDGQDCAAVVAARFPEMFAGAVLHQSDGHEKINVRKAGQLSGLAAYVIYDGNERLQLQFAEKLKADNPAGELVRSEDVGPMGSAKTIAAWMEKLGTRTGQPREIRYAVHDASFQRHYWINVLRYDASVKPAPMFIATANRATNEIRIDITGVTQFEVFLNDALVDLSKKVRIVVLEDDKELEFFNDKVNRDLTIMLDQLLSTNHPWRIYPARFLVDVPDLRARVAKQEAEKAAEMQKEDEKKPPDKAAQGK
ncbi:MAG: hypothetical protein ACYTEZ_00515 [Planctomycetota bacterium]|jgi:hypothetical protein